MGGAQAAVHKPPRTQGDNIASINPSARKKRPDRGCVGAAWLRRPAAIFNQNPFEYNGRLLRASNHLLQTKNYKLQTQKEAMTKPVLLKCYSEDRNGILQEG